MAIRSGFFNSINGDRKYQANKFAEYFATFIGNGVFPNPSTNLQVIANDDMTITAKPGRAWINGYILINDDDYILELDPADGVLDRIDRVVARYDVVDREIRLEVKKGDFASVPVPEELQRDADAYELGLADITISHGAISITQSKITDLRLDNEQCGMAHGLVEQVDTTTLYNQYQTWIEEKKAEYNQDLIDYINTKNNELNDWYYSTTAEFEEDFNTWFDTIQDLFDESTAGNLLSEINKINSKILRDRKEIIDIKLKLSEIKIIEFLNKTGIGFYDLFENLNYADLEETTATIDVIESEVVFKGEKILKMNEQQFDNFNELELAVYDKEREVIEVIEDSTDNTVKVLIPPSNVFVGDKICCNNRIYTVSTVEQVH